MMIEIKPNWRIAQEISRRHTLISLKVSLPFFIGIFLLALLTLKGLGYQHSGLVLHDFYTAHETRIISTMLFIHFVPVNLYAIIRVFNFDFGKFQLKIVSKPA